MAIADYDGSVSLY